MTPEFFKNNRQKLIGSLDDLSLTVVFAGHPPHRSADSHYNFVPNRHFYYLTGVTEPNVVLLLAKRGDRIEETLFIEKADPVLEKWEGKRMTADEAREVSGVQNVQFLDDFKGVFRRLQFQADFQTLYLDLERESYDQPNTPAMAFAKETRDLYPQLQIRSIYYTVAQLRRVKTDEEVANIRKAIEITNAGIRNMWTHAKPGMMEYELEAHFDYTLKANGVRDFAFPTILASGHNATVLHYGTNNSRTEDGDLVLIDLGAAYNLYSADISRTFPINGKFSERQKQVYNIVLKAEEEVIKACKPGFPASELNEICKRVLAEGLKELGLIEKDEEVAKYYYHGVSHLLGLDTHDVGAFRAEGTLLEPGMVVTVEPGLYIDEWDIGIRIEDDVLVTGDGYEVLSKDIIKTVDEIEEFFAKREQ
jgi:Xaa-Pro aminopeptidase